MVLPAALTTAIFLVSTILSMSTFTNVFSFAQAEGTNQTMQNAEQSANQTGKVIQQNVSDVVTNISKGAKSGIKYYYWNRKRSRWKYWEKITRFSKVNPLYIF